MKRITLAMMLCCRGRHARGARPRHRPTPPARAGASARTLRHARPGRRRVRRAPDLDGVRDLARECDLDGYAMSSEAARGAMRGRPRSITRSGDGGQPRALRESRDAKRAIDMEAARARWPISVEIDRVATDARRRLRADAGDGPDGRRCRRWRRWRRWRRAFYGACGFDFRMPPRSVGAGRSRGLALPRRARRAESAATTAAPRRCSPTSRRSIRSPSYQNEAPYYEAWARYKIGTTDELQHGRQAPRAARGKRTRRDEHATARRTCGYYVDGRRGTSDSEVAALYARINGALAQRGDRDAADEGREGRAAAGARRAIAKTSRCAPKRSTR